MTDNKHTPLPWKMITGGPGIAPHAITNIYPRQRIADVHCAPEYGFTDSAEPMANAAFIVQACNAHYELAGALQLGIMMLQAERNSHADSGDKQRQRYVEPIEGAIKTMQATLAKATGGKEGKP